VGVRNELAAAVKAANISFVKHLDFGLNYFMFQNENTTLCFPVNVFLFTYEYKWATLLYEVKSDMKTTRKTDANTYITYKYIHYIQIYTLHTNTYITYKYIHYIQIHTLHTNTYITYKYIHYARNIREI
jgi:hypothetical protein